VQFDSVDRNTVDGLARWRSAGSPPIPSIEIDGVTTTIMHVSHVARLLDLPAPPLLDQSRVAHDLTLLIGSWERMLRPLPPEAIVEPTASRGRSLRNLTMNAVYPISLLPAAHETGTFDWGLVDLDEERAAPYTDASSLADFTRSVQHTWSAFVLGNEDELATRDDWIEAPRGRMRFSELLEHQRWHLAFHHRQVVEFLETLGRGVGLERELAASIGVDLPDAVT
jgi:hypothetical protein